MDNDKAQEFRDIVLSPLKFSFFKITSLPMAYLAGLKVTKINHEQAIVTIRYKYLTKNPFRSIYFACLGMAAELSTGVLAMMLTYKSNPAVSMLVVKMESNFTKKAVGRISFTCNNGKELMQAVNESKATGESRQVTVESIGKDEKGDQVAQFFITWSFKAKSGS